MAEPELVGLSRSPRRPSDSEPSISYWSEFFRPALIWLMLTEPRAPFSNRSRIAAASSVAMSA